MHGKGLEGDCSGCFLSGQGSLLEYEYLSRSLIVQKSERKVI